MKKLYGLILLLPFISFVSAQPGDIPVGWGSLDYNVTESPAFSLLGNQPDNILKPTSVKSIALNIGNYYLSKGSVIPKNIGVEISPLLLSPNVTLNDFSAKPFLYRLRISAGSNKLENGAYQVSEGLRFTIIDKSDLRTDTLFINRLYQSCGEESNATTSAIQEYIKKYPDAFMMPKLPNAIARYSSDSIFKKTIDEMSLKYMINTINKLRDQRKKELWNAPIWEVGIALMQESPDSLLSHAKLSKVGLWSTYGSHFGKNDQLLIGCSFGMVDSISSWHPKLSVGSRYYYGKNELRGFVQAEYTHINKLNTATASTGIVFNITNGIWGQFTLNFISDFKGNVSFVPSFNIGFGTVEKKTL